MKRPKITEGYRVLFKYGPWMCLLFGLWCFLVAYYKETNDGVIVDVLCGVICLYCAGKAWIDVQKIRDLDSEIEEMEKEEDKWDNKL